MPLINLRNITLGHGGDPLIAGGSLTIEPRERLALIGRNGAGKSTLLKAIAGQVEFDAGTFDSEQGLKIAYLQQDIPHDLTGTIYDVVVAGLAHIGELLSEFDHVTHELLNSSDAKLLKKQAKLQTEIERLDGWSVQQRVDAVISRMSLDKDVDVSSLSGGMRRRVLLAKALVTEPDILLLDEPTNHLDIDAIIWLESFFSNYKKTVLFITHDRNFMQSIATRIIEIDNGQLFSWPGNYGAYLKHKAQALHAEEKEQANFDKKLSQEEVWIRQGIKARRTRNEGRVRALKKMRDVRSQRRYRPGKAKISLQDATQAGKIVFEVDNVSYGYDDKSIIKDFSAIILRGDKVGIVGPNGSGKSTLIKLLLDELTPQVGHIKRGTQLQVAYFDQYREDLDNSKTPQDLVAGGSDMVIINGKPRHVISYLQDFLFSPQRARAPIKALSGGERNRLLLAMHLAKPSNILVMDEPTNDLDMETLELLEEQLTQYQGTLLLVTHDRAFLNNIVTSTLVLEGGGRVGEYVGNYDDWQRQIKQQSAVVKTSSQQHTPILDQTPKAAKKLSYNDQRELDALPDTIAKLEAQIDELHTIMASSDFYQQSTDDVAKVTQQLSEFEQQLSTAYQRWEELEG